MTRKQELQQELDAIKKKELETQMKEAEKVMGSTAAQEKLIEAQAKAKQQLDESKSHRYIMYGDFGIKFIIALFVSWAFIHIVYTGNVDAMEGGEIIGAPSSNGNFQLLSVVGPLFGMVLQYYFGAKKKSANGE